MHDVLIAEIDIISKKALILAPKNDIIKVIKKSQEVCL